MIDTEALKKIIIDKATAGILTSHFSGDGDVNEIIKRLPSLSNKRKKLLEQSFDYGKEYDIPSHWKWVRLGEISSYGDTPTKVMPSDMKEGTWILELEDIESGGRLVAKKRYPDRKPAGEKTAFNKGQILYSKLRPYLKKVLIADEDGMSTPELIAFDVFADIKAKYISYCLVNSYVDKIINQRSYGVKMPRVDTGFMANLPVPLPPLEEQERIVDLVEQSMIAIDTIATLQQQYESDLSVLKGKIIDAGIRGKLTEQLPEDGDAEDLYAQILNQKSQLIKEGKIKKEKPLPDITADENPFEIPKNWKWVRVSNIAYLTSGKPYEETEEGELYIKVSDMNLPENGIQITTSKHFVDKKNDGIIPVNSIIFPKRGGAIATNKKRMVLQNHVFVDLNTMGMTVIISDIFMFVKYWFETVKLDEIQNGTTIPQVNNKDIYPLILPLPPLAEQKRITKKIDELLQIIG